MTPVSTITRKVSVCLALVAIIALCAGYFVTSSICGTAAAINLLAGIYLKKY